MFNISNHICFNHICKKENYLLNYNILYDIINLNINYNQLKNNNKIIDYINNKIDNNQSFNVCNKIGYCCKNGSNSITYVILPESYYGFKKLTDLYKLYNIKTFNKKQFEKKYINENVPQKQYCYTCATLILSYYLNNSNLFNLKSFELYNILLYNSFQINNLKDIKTYYILFNNNDVFNKKKHINIEFDLINVNLKKTNKNVKYIEKITDKCDCIYCCFN